MLALSSPSRSHIRPVVIGAAVGSTAAALSCVPFGAFAGIALLFSLVPGFVAGICMGLVANRLDAGAWERRFLILATGLAAVFFAEFFWTLSIGLLYEDRINAFSGFLLGAIAAVLLGAIAAVLAIPGLLAGAVILEKLVGQRRPDDDWRVASLERRLSLHPADEAGLALNSLDDGSPAIRLVVIRWLARRADAPLPILERHLACGPAADHRVLACAFEEVAIRGAADPVSVETSLLEILVRGDWHAQAQAIHGLGVVGSTRSLEALTVLLGIRYLPEEASEAITRIRRRQPNAQPGHLSHAEPRESAGALSDVPSAGRLSSGS